MKCCRTLSNSKKPATITAGYNIDTGEVAARACGGGKCAEDHVVDALGGNPDKRRFDLVGFAKLPFALAAKKSMAGMRSPRAPHF